jgi:hypothetical protein
MMGELLKLPLLAVIAFTVAYSAGWGFKLSGWQLVQSECPQRVIGKKAAAD